MKLKVGKIFFEIDKSSLENYFSEFFSKSVHLINLIKVGEGFHNVGYLAVFNIEGEIRKILLRIVRGDKGWGHEYLSDRASVLLLQHELLNSAPKGKSPKSIDVVCLNKSGKFVSIGNAIEFINFTEVVDEKEYPSYSNDLFKIAKRRLVTEKDIKKCRIIADYLAELHSMKKKNVLLYKRHLRDLIGHGEMLMGVIDTYPNPSKLGFVSGKELMQIEIKAVEWRNKIKHMSNRLSRIHGDFHPFGNVRFNKNDSILVMDFSREKFGEPADDISSLSINYIFFSVWHYGEFINPYKILFNEFFSRYLKRTKDENLFKVLPPFYAFRGLVVAHPHYYPNLETKKRRMMINFILNVLKSKKFEIEKIEKYLH